MSEPETIVLTRSGIVLPRCKAAHPRWQLRTGDHEFIFEELSINGTLWTGVQCFVAADNSRYCMQEIGTRDDCLAWLDSRVLELRAALRAPGTVEVRADEETVERVALAMFCAKFGSSAASVWPTQVKTLRDDYHHRAHAVLAALGAKVGT